MWPRLIWLILDFNGLVSDIFKGGFWVAMLFLVLPKNAELRRLYTRPARTIIMQMDTDNFRVVRVQSAYVSVVTMISYLCRRLNRRFLGIFEFLYDVFISSSSYSGLYIRRIKTIIEICIFLTFWAVWRFLLFIFTKFSSAVNRRITKHFCRWENKILFDFESWLMAGGWNHNKHVCLTSLSYWKFSNNQLFTHIRQDGKIFIPKYFNNFPFIRILRLIPHVSFYWCRTNNLPEK